MSDYLPPVVLELEGRDARLRATLAAAKTEVRRWAADVGRTSATVDVNVRGITAANTALRRLRDEAQDAGRALDGLTARAAATTVALRALKDAAQDASRALRSMNTAARNADGRLSAMSDRSRTLRRDTDDLDGSMRRLTTTMGGLRGSTGSIRLDSTSNSMGRLRAAAIGLSPALIPIAASLTPIVASAGAGVVAVGAFAAAIAGQISVAQSAADAQGTYTEAVAKHGAASQQAAQAESQWLAAVKKMDPETRRAGAAMQVLNDSFRQWSKELAPTTMPVFTKGIAALGEVLVQTAPLAGSTATELDRLMTVLAGGVNSRGFSLFMAQFSEFASGAVRKATDGLVHFMRVLSEGGGSSQFSEFMAYVKEVGPKVGETLGNLGRALAHFMAAASDVGVSILSVVNSFAKLVNAIPTDVLSNLLQFVIVFKAVKLAALGLGGAGGAVAGFVTSLTAMRAASAAAGGGLSGLAAAFGTLSRASKVALIGSGIGILVVALSALSEMSKKAPPDVDKLTTSMREFAAGGTVSGEAARSFGKDLSGLADSLQKIKDPKGLDQIQQSIVSFFGTDSTPVKEAKENIDAIDRSLANLVKNGQADLAKAALDQLTAAMKKQGFSSKDITSQLDDYKAALKDQAFEAELAAQAQGVFGLQAQAVQKKLDAQKASADGLRQSIQALSDTSRGAFDAQTKFEQAIDDVAKSLKDNGATLDINTDKGRANRDTFSQLASATQDAAAKARENGAQWSEVMGIYDKGRKTLVDNATKILGNKKAAEEYVDQLLKIPKDASTIVKMNKEDAQRSLAEFNAAVKKTPDAKSVTLKALSKGAEAILAAFGMKVKRLPDGSVKVTAKNGQALTGIGDVAAALRNLDGNTATTYVETVYTQTTVKYNESRQPRSRRHGGLEPGYASGGYVQSYPNGGLISGPGTPTSDSILMLPPSGGAYRASDREYIVQAAAVRQYGVAFLDALNAGQVRLAGYASGGLTDAMKQARAGLRGQFGISSFGKMAGYSRTGFEKALGAPSDVNALVSSLNQLRGQIKAAFTGRTESSLLKQLNSAGKSLISYDKQLVKVTASLAKAKDKLDDLKSSAAQLKASVASSILQGTGVVTQAPQEGFALTSQDVVNNMSAQLARVTQFSAQLETLKKRGLSATLLEQIASAGVEQGGATAAALAGASDATLKQLNSLQAQMKSTADRAGAAVADSMYGAGIRAAEGLVKGLEKQKKQIETAMMNIAKSMEKAIKKALGIKSPSTVMARLGDFTALGLAAGIHRSSKHAVIAAQGMAMSVQQGAALTGTPTLTATLPAVRPDGGAVIVHNHAHVTVEGHVLTERGLRNVVEEQMLRLGMRNPATYSSYKR